MGSLNIAKCPNSSSKHSQSMTAALYLCLLAFHQASLAPQYADQTNQELSGNQLDVFGDSQVEEVDSAHTVKNEAVCWIDYAMSCHQGRTSGEFSSYWGHSHQCQAWMDGELNRLNQEVLAMQSVES